MWEKVSELKSTLGKYFDASSVPILPSRVEVKKVVKCLEILNEYSLRDELML